MSNNSQYAPVDRSTLNLPSHQTCDTCQKDKPHTAYKLKIRNQHSISQPHELRTTCVHCEQEHRKPIKGAYLNAIASGNQMLSDAGVLLLQEDNGRNAKDFMKRLFMMASDGQLDAMKLFASLTQGRQPLVKQIAVKQTDQNNEITNSNSSEVESAADDLLDKIADRLD